MRLWNQQLAGAARPRLLVVRIHAGEPVFILGRLARLAPLPRYNRNRRNPFVLSRFPTSDVRRPLVSVAVRVLRFWLPRFSAPLELGDQIKGFTVFESQLPVFPGAATQDESQELPLLGCRLSLEQIGGLVR